MHIKDIDIDDLIAEVKKIAAANPDHIYTEKGPNRNGDTRCYYERNGKPSCIMGQALHALGVPIEELAEFDGPKQGSIITLLTVHGKYSTYYDEYKTNRSKFTWINDVQYLQDALKPWGMAVDTADSEMARREAGAYSL